VDDRIVPPNSARSIWGKRNGLRLFDADRFPPSQLLAQEMGDALKRWLSANVEQPFAEYARLKHTGAPAMAKPNVGYCAISCSRSLCSMMPIERAR